MFFTTWTDLLPGVYDITVAVADSSRSPQKIVDVSRHQRQLQPAGGIGCEMVTAGEFGDGGFYPKSECQAQPEAELSLVILGTGDRQRITDRDGPLGRPQPAACMRH